MNTTSSPAWATRAFSLLIVALACLGGVGCFRSLDPDKIKCVDNSSCPSGSSCILGNDKQGHCQSAALPGDGGSTGGITGASQGGTSGVRDGALGGSGGGAGGGVGGIAGSSQGGASGTRDGGAGAGGTSFRDGGAGAGGTTSRDGGAGAGGSRNDASSGAGGTTSPDAPINSDGPGAANGAPCKADGECSSTHCIDGVCCATTCTGCNACSGALTGQPDGTCAFVASGKVAHQACTDETATKPCGNDGTCDGKGACRKVAAGKSCGAATCKADNSFVPEPTCDGVGVCNQSAAQPCSPYQCSATGCNKKCSKAADCDAGTYCDMGLSTCVPTKANGVAAAQALECTSGIIADGVCCNAACTEQCKACSLTSSKGACTRIGTGQPVHGEPCSTDGTTCGGSCNGSKDTCSYPASGQSCGSASCSSDLTTLNASACNGTGACSPANQSCSAGGRFCDSGTTSCAAKKDSGSCSQAIQCSSGHCCGNSCVSLGTNSHCSACGDACSAGKTCQGGQCACGTGYTACGGSCCNSATQYCSGTTCMNRQSTGPCSSAQQCTSGLYCTGSPGYCCAQSSCGTGQTCTSGSCQCAYGSASVCGCLGWNFEDGTRQGWTGSNMTLNASSPGYSSSWALNWHHTYTEYSDTAISLSVPICSGGSNVLIQGISFMTRFVPDDGVSEFPFTKACKAILLDSGGSEQQGSFTSFGGGASWAQKSSTFSPVSAASLRLNLAAMGQWTGTVYIDNVTLTPAN